MKVGTTTLCVFLAAAAAMAQSDRGSITGTVTDPAAAVVPAARIGARNVDTGAVTEGTTTATGNYTLASLTAGTYDVTVEAAGFKKLVQSGVKVQVAQTERLDFTLQVGVATESVTVTGEAPARGSTDRIEIRSPFMSRSQ